MRGASDARYRVIGLVLVWAVIFAASYAVPMTMEATGDGFTRGLNRFGYWFWPQAAAFVLAIVVWTVAAGRRAQLSNGLIWLARLPLIVVGVQVAAFVALVIFAMITVPA